MTRPALLRDGRFLAGLLLRILLLLACAPLVQSQWFLPFLDHAVRAPLSPWGDFLAAGGDPVAFPYGVPYLAAYLPTTLIGGAIAGPMGARLGLGIAILAFDIVLLWLLTRLADTDGERRSVVPLYWLSPIPLYVGYWHGQLDVFPAMLLTAAFLAISMGGRMRAALIYGIAIAAKLSMLLPAPYLALYMFGRARSRRHMKRVTGLSAIVAAALLLPFCLSPAFRHMVLDTPEAAKTFSFSLPIGDTLRLYILPLALLGLLHLAWQVRRLNFEMLWIFSGMIFMAFLLLTPASPGWAMWAVPFLAMHAARARATAMSLYLLFSTSFVALHLLISSGPMLAGDVDLRAPLIEALGAGGSKLSSVVFTIMLASGAALAAQMYRYGVEYTLFRAATRRPLMIGISGDSGAGKDTLVDSIEGMFGGGAIAKVSGDNYHIWDRHKPMWRALTHLNPKANDLDGFANNVRDLAHGRAVWVPHYDHRTGKMTKPERLAPAEIITASGLHALWSPALNAIYDIRIYLDMDEDLRAYLKIDRDVRVRGHPRPQVEQSIESRRPDARRFIHPQAAAADLLLKLEPGHRSALSKAMPAGGIPLRLIAQSNPGDSFDALARLLASICGFQVIAQQLDSGKNEILVEGDATAEDIALVARHLAPKLAELLDPRPIWESGLKGVIQLIVLDQVNRACRRRRITG